jgi:hypothetical protein
VSITELPLIPGTTTATTTTGAVAVAVCRGIAMPHTTASRPSHSELLGRHVIARGSRNCSTCTSHHSLPHVLLQLLHLQLCRQLVQQASTL